MLSKTEIRELTFKYIFSTFFFKEDNIIKQADLDRYFDVNEIDKEVGEEIYKTVYILQDHYNYIFETIKKNLKSDWEMSRIARIDLAILFLAITEMIYEKLPYKVVINEAVELAKKYGTDNSAKFVNGILASVVKDEGLEQ